MTKPQTEMLIAIENAGVIAWTSILCMENGAKQFATRQSRNATTAQSLVDLGMIKHASGYQIIEVKEAFDRHTARIVRRLKSATEKGQWAFVSKLADELQYRKFESSLFVINR